MTWTFSLGGHAQDALAEEWLMEELRGLARRLPQVHSAQFYGQYVGGQNLLPATTPAQPWEQPT